MVDFDVCKEAWYASLWHTIEKTRAQENHVFFVLYHMDLHMVVKNHPRLSPSLYHQYNAVAKFKAEYHRIYVQAQMDTMKTWHPLPYLATKDDISTLIQKWLI